MKPDQSTKLHESNVDMERLKSLFRSMLAQKSDMHDYLTAQIRRGGYYYRDLCALLKITYLNISILGNKIRIEFSNGVILFENDQVSIVPK